LTCAGAQSIERKSVELPQISDVKSQLKTATGWALRANGQWVKSGNAIAIPGNSKGQSDNFNSFQLREVAIDDKVYSLLIKKMTRLAYKYPELQMDVYRQEVMLWFVFDKAKLEKVIDEKTEMDKSYGVDLEVLYSDERALFPFLSYGMKEIASEIQSEKQANKKGYNFKNALMAVFPVNYKGKKLVRFNFLSGYGPSFEKETFDNAYYEVDYDAFYKFIRY
jgi:hypothetical protein